MALGSVFLAFITVAIDRSIDPDRFQFGGLLAPNSIESTRTILSIITGSMISIAGVTFSLTMVAVTNAAAQYGPRLVGNFMRDRANQFTLGVFTSTFIYGLLILRVAHIGGETSAGEAIPEFVPNISVLTCIGMTLLSVGVLIYFVHHIPETLNVGNITARLGRDLRNNLRNLVDQENQNRPRTDIKSSPFSSNNALRVPAVEEGYIQTLNLTYLLKQAVEHDLIIDLQFQPGDFVTQDDILMDLWCRDGSPIPTNIRDDVLGHMRSAFAMGQARTVHQNYLYLADELVEVLARALSPGINDPYTAVNCIHWFQSALNVMVNQPDPVADRFDSENKLRIIVKPLTFEKLLNLIGSRSRAYIASDKIATMEMLAVLGRLGAKSINEKRKAALELEMSLLVRAAYDALPSSVDREAVAALATEISASLANKKRLAGAGNQETWFGGTA